MAEHASARFGGEAILPLHYFRYLRERGEEVWLLVHERTRQELMLLLSDSDFERVLFTKDTSVHRLLWKLGKKLPARIKSILCDAPMHLLTQFMQRRQVKKIIPIHSINIVHEPMPVSARQPSAMFGFGVPVLIGPMNGGMSYPPAFKSRESRFERALGHFSNAAADFANIIIPGKRRAAMLLVANERTHDALPRTATMNVQLLCENGVDLSVWKSDCLEQANKINTATTFIFMGRLIPLKSIDILIEAFARVVRHRPAVKLVILGDGPCRSYLEQLAADLGCSSSVTFAGFLPQSDCAAALAACDVFVFPSIRECGGAVVLEAMAMGKPVIATAWGGPVDYLEGGGGVLIAPDGRDSMVRAFAQEMEAMALSRERRDRLGEVGRRRVEQEFDWNVKIDQIMAIYQDICREYIDS